MHNNSSFVYFSPSYHKVNSLIQLKTKDTLYIPVGAFVKMSGCYYYTLI